MAKKETKAVQSFSFAKQFLQRYLLKHPQDVDVSLERLSALLPCQKPEPGDTSPTCTGLGFDNSAQGNQEFLQPMVFACPCKMAKTKLRYLFASGVLRSESLSFTVKSHLPELAWHVSESPVATVQDALQALLVLAKDTPVLEDKFLPPRWIPHLTPHQKRSLNFFEKLAHFQKPLFESGRIFLRWKHVVQLFSTRPARRDKGWINEPTLFESREEFTDQLRSDSVVFLALESATFLSRRASTEADLFEAFLGSLSNSGAGLVVFATQPLVDETEDFLGGMLDYRAKPRGTFRDAQGKLRFESSKVSAQLPIGVNRCLRQGAYDRLLEMLMVGQSHLDNSKKESVR